ncbi:hypothetical protein GW17_00015679 [Ensete ventricosum]|nr:hypothetical protein GW17_00015679 [Ensete ventricosum]
MEVGRWSSRPSLMTPKPARKGRDRSWFLQLVPNQVQLSRWRSKSAAPQEIISRSSRTSRRRRLCDGLRDDELAVVPSLSRHVADHGLRVGAPSFSDFDRGSKSRTGGSDVAMAAETEEDLLLRSFMAEVSGVERDNEVASVCQFRILSCFKLNPFEHLNLSFDSSVDEVKKQYRKVELLSYF